MIEIKATSKEEALKKAKEMHPGKMYKVKDSVSMCTEKEDCIVQAVDDHYGVAVATGCMGCECRCVNECETGVPHCNACDKTFYLLEMSQKEL